MVATQTLSDDLSARGFQRPMLWPRGVDEDMFRPVDELPAELQDLPRPFFLYCGRLAPEKNIEAFLALDLPGSKIVVGDGPSRAPLQEKFPKTHFTGVKSRGELAPYYSSADVFVFPSRTDTFGNVMLEALACGAPVAAFPVPGPVDVVTDTRIGVLDEDLRAACLGALTPVARRTAAPTPCATPGRKAPACSSTMFFAPAGSRCRSAYRLEAGAGCGRPSSPLKPGRREATRGAPPVGSGAPMNLLVEISVGELIDKITILEIKLDNIEDEAKRANVAREYAALTGAMPAEVGASQAVAGLRRELKAVNAELWRIEDDIRAHERAKTFGAEFIELARSVYITNDKRALLKNRLNILTKSNLVEEKSYSAY